MYNRSISVARQASRNSRFTELLIVIMHKSEAYQIVCARAAAAVEKKLVMRRGRPMSAPPRPPGNLEKPINPEDVLKKLMLPDRPLKKLMLPDRPPGVLTPIMQSASPKQSTAAMSSAGIWLQSATDDALEQASAKRLGAAISALVSARVDNKIHITEHEIADAVSKGALSSSSTQSIAAFEQMLATYVQSTATNVQSTATIPKNKTDAQSTATNVQSTTTNVQSTATNVQSTGSNVQSTARPVAAHLRAQPYSYKRRGGQKIHAI